MFYKLIRPKLFILLCLLPCTVSCAGLSKTDQLFNDLGPGRKVLNLSDINWKSCKGYGNLSNLVVDDFNGDNLLDIAVLIVNDIDKPPVEWNGELVQEREIELVVYMNQGSGKYKKISLEKLPTFFPTEITIKLQSNGIDRVYCERSETVYYWDNNKFNILRVSD